MLKIFFENAGRTLQNCWVALKRGRLPARLLIFSFLMLIIAPVLFSPNAWAADAPFTNANNWGATGLMEMPTARVLNYGYFRVGISQIEPYRNYFGAVTPIKGLELTGRMTEVMSLNASEDPAWKGYGNYKDKFFGLKYQFIPEGKYWPALALGIMDPQGTRIYGGQYLVMSKQIFPFDFTLGFGNGRFGKQQLPGTDGEKVTIELFQDPQKWLSDGQFFGGIEFHPLRQLSFMVEYNPIKYHLQTKDPAQKKYFTEAVPSPVNFGVRYKPFDWTQLDLSYQRGNQLGVNLSFVFDLDGQLMPIFDLPYKEREKYKYDPLSERIARGLYLSGFRDIGVKISGTEIWVEAANVRYLYNMRAMGVLLKVLDQVLPDDIHRINVVLTDRGIPVVEFGTRRDDLRNFESEVFKLNEYLSLTEINTSVYRMPATSLQHKRYFDYGIKPELQTFTQQASQFFQYRAGVSGWIGLEPWKGGSFSVGVAAYPLNTIKVTVAPLPNPVRSDGPLYAEKTFSLSSLMFEQIGKTKYEIYGKAAVGMLETQYAGLDAEMALPLFRGRILAGVGGSLVKKRDIEDPLKLNNNDWSDNYKTAFLNARLNLPELEMALDVKAGRFLAGDTGARLTVTKSFFNGVSLSAWYSFTDTSGFTDTSNKGYHDKGIGITVPLRLFLGRDSRTLYPYNYVPWGRDVAQDIAHRTPLFDFIGRNTKKYVDKDAWLIK